MPRFFVGTVSKEHVVGGVAGGFAQLCHGKEGSLRRMSVGDALVYYSPAQKMGGGDPVQAFTAVGRVVGDACYRVKMAPDFEPYRRDVEYAASAKDAPIRPLIPKLEFLKDRGSKWGGAFRFGQLEISRADFETIARAMGVDPDRVLGAGAQAPVPAAATPAEEPVVKRTRSAA